MDSGDNLPQPPSKPTFSLRQLFIAVTAFRVLLMIGVPLYRGCSPLVSESEKSGLRIGMAKDEVARILGDPHDTCCTDGPEYLWAYDEWAFRLDPLVLEFDEDDRLVRWHH